MRTTDKELYWIDECGKALGVRVRPAAYGASVCVDGVETYYKTKSAAATAALDEIAKRDMERDALQA